SDILLNQGGGNSSAHASPFRICLPLCPYERIGLLHSLNKPVEWRDRGLCSAQQLNSHRMYCHRGSDLSGVGSSNTIGNCQQHFIFIYFVADPLRYEKNTSCFEIRNEKIVFIITAHHADICISGHGSRNHPT